MSAYLPEFHSHVALDKAGSVYDLQLDGSKIGWWKERVEAWNRGEKVAPITIDVAWTRQCNAACSFCAAQFQASDGEGPITKQNAFDFMSDAAEIGVKGISLISDGESTVVPWYAESIEYGAKVGLKIGVGSNGVRLKREVLERILPNITYLRFNISGGERKRYSEIMGLKGRDYDRVVQNIRDAMMIKKRDNLPVSINLQMVTTPDMKDQILPLARLAKDLMQGVDGYCIFKHCADDREGFLGVDYSRYSELYDTFKEAEALSDATYRVVVKWSRLADEGKRDYDRCYGPPFLLQISGNGTVSTCGQMFQERFRKYHMGSIVTERFKDIWASDRYWEIIRFMASEEFTAQMCGSNCVQTRTNSWLDKYKKGILDFENGPAPPHLEFL